MSTNPREPQLPERELPSQVLPERDPELKVENQPRIDGPGNNPGVEELAGVEYAGDHPEKLVPTHEKDQRAA